VPCPPNREGVPQASLSYLKNAAIPNRHGLPAREAAKPYSQEGRECPLSDFLLEIPGLLRPLAALAPRFPGRRQPSSRLLDKALDQEPGPSAGKSTLRGAVGHREPPAVRVAGVRVLVLF